MKEDRKQERSIAREKKLRQKVLEAQRTRVYQTMLAKEKARRKEKKVAPQNVYISLKNIQKIYPNKVQAVFDFNLDIYQKEFIVFVGPSGCGKSTTLRMIAGLEDITAGDLFIDSVYANQLEPKNRDIAMVFQSYALYTHMSVFGNMSFGLKIRKVPMPVLDKAGNPVLKIAKGLIRDYQKELKNLKEFKAECLAKGDSVLADKQDGYIQEIEEKIAHLQTTPVPCIKNQHLPRQEVRQRVEKAAKILQIEEYLDRKPKNLSGGQCQRVALGRAIVRNAKVFLMDEPLSNLDAKLRVAMRSEIVKLHQSLQATTIYVTHDQTEAMTMASRIVVMNKGYIQQIGTPIEIYNHPANLFVATFIGSPAMNLYTVNLKKDTIQFEDGTKFAIGKAFKEAVEHFYQSERNVLKEELVAIDAAFVERNQLLHRLAHLTEEKRKKDVTLDDVKMRLEKELQEVESCHERRAFVVDAIHQMDKLDSKEGYPIIFGVRPEDIYAVSNQKIEDLMLSEAFALEVQVAELMGHEYFVHTTFAHKDLVSKIAAKKLIAAGDQLKLSFDLSRIHLFDRITSKLIR